MKKRIFLVALLLCCLALAGTGTLAYFTAKDTAMNIITTGELDMELVELQADGTPFPEDGIAGVMPGDAIGKKVTVKNVGGVDFYARVKTSFVLTDAQGNTDALTMENITLDINAKDWTKQGDYYYYNRSIAPGQESEPLFSTVNFGTALDNAYQNARLEILVEAEAVQSRNNTDSPLTAAGWDSND